MSDPGPLIEPLIPAMRRYAYALLRDHTAADDLVQDALERALAGWSTRHVDGDLKAWLFTILRNLHVSSHRRDARRGTAVALDEAEGTGTAPTQDRAMEARDVLSAVSKLPEDQRSLLILVGVEDLSYSQAARVLDVPIGTVMSRLSRARRALRSIVEGGSAPLLRRLK